jgi:hypothetical protein
MPIISKVPELLIDRPVSVIQGFVRLRKVTGGVACVNLGKADLDYRGIIKVSPINFSQMSLDDQDILIASFRTFLNGLPFPIQVLIRNQPYNLDQYLRTFENTSSELIEQARDHAMFVRYLSANRPQVKRSYYVIVPADHARAKNRTEALANAQTQIGQRIDQLLRQLERHGLTGQRLKDEEIVALYQDCLFPGETQASSVSKNLIDGTRMPMMSQRDRARVDDFPIYMQETRETKLPEELAGAKSGKSKKEKAAKARKRDNRPKAIQSSLAADFSNLPDLLAPSSVQVTPWHLRIDGEAGEYYTRTLAFVNYPKSAYPGWLGNLLQISEPYLDFSIHITPVETQQVSTQLDRKVAEMRDTAQITQRQAQAESTDLLRGIEQTRRSLLSDDEHFFRITALIQVHAGDKQELTERCSRVASAVRSLDFRLLPTHWQHHISLLSCLPDGDNPLERGHLFGTSAASTFYPFMESNVSMDSGVMFGLAPESGMVIVNPFKKDELENANMVVFASPGAGKSFFFKTLTCRLVHNCNVYVIEQKAEYNKICTHFGGQYIRLSSDALQLNPFDLYFSAPLSMQEPSHPAETDKGGFFREKLLSLVALFELLLSNDGTLSQKEKAFLYKCLVKAYEVRGITLDRTTHGRPVPNMQDMYFIMSSAARGDQRLGVGEDTYGLSERLERYLSLFPEKTTVVPDKRFIAFNIQDLNDTLKPIGLFLINDFLWTKMQQSRLATGLQPHALMLIDEIWPLMQQPQEAKFLSEWARRIQSYGAGLWCSTQHVNEFLNAEEGRTILALSAMKFLLRQDVTTIESVANAFRLSSDQRNFLLRAKSGEGLFATKSWVSMDVVSSTMEAEVARATPGVYVPSVPTGLYEQRPYPSRI